jgi:DNA (cytosine-5)-methyltransferase 1
MKKDKLKVISLFSGYGTQELALKYIGVDYEVIASCDNFKQANECYDVLHKTQIGNLGDITKVDNKNFPECDLLTYSFPCQSVSISGKQEGIKEGTRSGLLYEVERILSTNRPKYLLMENVKNLLSKNHYESFKKHIYFLRGLGYTSYWRLLNGADFGCPQNRERVFMISVLNGDKDDVKQRMENVDTHKKTRIPMRPFIEDTQNPELFIDCQYTPHEPKGNTVCKLIARRDDVSYDQARRIYSVDACSPCLTTSGSPQIMTEDGRVRNITAREGYRFMGVRDEDIDLLLTTSLSTKGHVSLAGNSICVPVMEAIFSEFLGDYIVEKEPVLSNQSNETTND